MFKRINCVLCRWLCGDFLVPRVTEDGVPPKVRIASHELANAAMRLEGAVRRIRRAGEDLNEVAKVIEVARAAH